MATAAQLRQRVLDNLWSSSSPAERPAIQRINGTFNSSVETITVDSGTPINIGDVIENDNGEQMFVSGKNANDLSVYRGWNGTTAASITDNTFVRINPRWTMKKVDDELAAIAYDLHAQGLYVLKQGTDLTLVSGTDLYDITETDLHEKHGVVSIFYQEASNSDLVGIPFHNVWDPTGDILTGGFAVRLLDWGNNGAGDTLTVVYAKKITAAGDSADEPLLEDLFVLGATGRALVALEGPRIHDPGRFTDRTVQPGQPIRDGAFFSGQYQRAVWRYRAFLQTKEKNLPGARWRRVRRYVP